MSTGSLYAGRQRRGLTRIPVTETLGEGSVSTFSRILATFPKSALLPSASRAGLRAGLRADAQTRLRAHAGRHLPQQAARPGSAAGVGSKACQSADPCQPPGVPARSPPTGVSREPSDCGRRGLPSCFSGISRFPCASSSRLCPKGSALGRGSFRGPQARWGHTHWSEACPCWQVDIREGPAPLLPPRGRVLPCHTPAGPCAPGPRGRAPGFQER